MTIKSATETRHLALSQDDMSKNFKRIVLAVPATALAIGAAIMMLQPKFGLLGAALLFGWTQMVGL